AMSQPSSPPAATNRAAAMCNRLNMVLLLGENRPRQPSPRHRWVNRSEPDLSQSERLVDRHMHFQMQIEEHRGMVGCAESPPTLPNHHTLPVLVGWVEAFRNPPLD